MAGHVDVHVEDGGTSLTYKRTTLVASLQAELDKRKADREEKKAKLAAKNKEAHDRIVEGLGNPQFLVWVVQRLTSGGFDATDDGFVKKVADMWPQSNGEELSPSHDPDGHLKRLIRVFEKAEDDTVTVSVDDEVYSYL